MEYGKNRFFNICEAYDRVRGKSSAIGSDVRAYDMANESSEGGDIYDRTWKTLEPMIDVDTVDTDFDGETHYPYAYLKDDVFAKMFPGSNGGYGYIYFGKDGQFLSIDVDFTVDGGLKERLKSMRKAANDAQHNRNDAATADGIEGEMLSVFEREVAPASQMERSLNEKFPGCRVSMWLNPDDSEGRTVLHFGISFPSIGEMKRENLESRLDALGGRRSWEQNAREANYNDFGVDDPYYSPYEESMFDGSVGESVSRHSPRRVDEI